jgi:protein tyrosine phosphatase (PTP) superfamily phosphohydrolase (DUF442 family)
MNVLLHRLQFFALYHNVLKENHESPAIMYTYIKAINHSMIMRKKLLVTGVIVSLTAVILLSLYYLFLSAKIYPVIESRIYRSAQLSDKALEMFIKEKGIKTIINLRGKDTDSSWYADESRMAGDMNVKLFDIRLLSDELPRYRKLAAILSLLQNAEKPLLIHCKRGADRTGLVSALALVLEQDPPLSVVKKQFSALYGVLPVYRSAGPSFFSLYEQWLNKTGKTHDKAALLEWIRNEYKDRFGNLEFWVEEINTTRWNDFRRKKFTIPEHVNTLCVKGWAFDASTNTPPDNLQIIFGNARSFKTDFTRNRPDVARYFKLGDPYYQTFEAGWEITISKDLLPAGCHVVTLGYMKGDTAFSMPAETTVCR